jgi:Fe-S oxidoreductase
VDEARSEASRCFLCDCKNCWENCEMIKWFRKMPPRLGVEVYTDSQSGSSLSMRSLTRETYSCNICGKCKSVCPVGVDVGALMQFSREDRFSTGKNIPAFHDFWIRQFDFHTSEAFFQSPPKGEKKCEYLFFPGCQLGAAEPDRVLKTYDYLHNKFNAGIMVGCCGAPAYWAGDKKRLMENLEHIRLVWENMDRPVFIFACAYCENIFRMLMPEIRQQDLYTLMAKDDTIVPARPFDEAAMFHPCIARDDVPMQEGVRTLAGRAGIALEELDNPNRCCGYGGHMRLANPGLYNEITDHRKNASDKPYIVYCANCREVFRQKGKECAHILDMIHGIDPEKCAPTLKSQKQNSLEVKKRLMKELTGRDFNPEKHEWDSISISISPELQDELDKKLIIEDDLKEAIWLANQTGERFVSDDGLYQCSMVKAFLTYWVQYKELAEGGYEILSAYIHRMKFNREG